MRKLSILTPDIPTHYLMVGEGGLFEQPTAVTTVLGSCVSVTFYHPKTQVGGIFHALMPCWDKYSGRDPNETEFRFVDSGIRRIVYLMQRMNIPRREIVTKIFGGANTLGQEMGMGKSNATTAFETLDALKLNIAASDVGGDRGRKLLFMTHTGDVYVRRVNALAHCVFKANQAEKTTRKQKAATARKTAIKKKKKEKCRNWESFDSRR